MNESIEFLTKVLAVLGGIGVIAGGVAAWVSKILSDRILENHKAALSQELERLKAALTQEGDKLRLSLKKQELIFSKDLEAATAFLTIVDDIYPKYSNPDQEWDDACSEAADKFEANGERLEKFLLSHGPIIPKHLRIRIETCKGLAMSHKFDSSNEGEYKRSTLEAAGEFLESLIRIKDDLLDETRSWEPGKALN